MKKLIHSIYKQQATIYKVFLFLLSVVFIVYLFPKGGSFKYEFDKGDVWQYEHLYAPFDFAVQKTDEQLNGERKQLRAALPLYFTVDNSIKVTAEQDVLLELNAIISDSILLKPIIKGNIAVITKAIYKEGLLAEDLQIAELKEIILKEANSDVASASVFSRLIKTEQIEGMVNSTFRDSIYTPYRSQITSIFYNNIKPNTRFNKKFTEDNIQQEISKILPTIGLVNKDAIIIGKGEVVEGDKLQKLHSLKEIYTSQVWSESNYNWIVFGHTILVILALLMLVLFLKKYRFSVYENNTKFTFIFFNIVLMIFITTLLIKYQVNYLYVVPICILPLVLKAFFDARLGLFAHVITVLLLGFVVPNSFEYMFLQIIAGIITVLTISELYKRANLFISVAQITLVYIVAYFSFYIIQEGSIVDLRWEIFGIFLLGGLATLFAQPLIYIFEKLFGLVSDVSLLELSDTNSKLLKRLADEAPGTFHHSLNVANLAEAAANEIGANAMLVRVGGLYHDIGKMSNPTYFIENQSNNINPHQELGAKESAEIIIDHVLNGIEIAKKYNLPDRIIDFIRTHHGTSTVYYFYKMAKDQDEMVDIKNFQYPGPKPFSKETAILMMCDSVEAASKSIKNPDYTKLSNFVEQIIEKQKNNGQFLNANITFKEIELIKKVLIRKLINIYHVRIEYPD